MRQVLGPDEWVSNRRQVVGLDVRVVVGPDEWVSNRQRAVGPGSQGWIQTGSSGSMGLVVRVGDHLKKSHQLFQLAMIEGWESG